MKIVRVRSIFLPFLLLLLTNSASKKSIIAQRFSAKNDIPTDTVRYASHPKLETDLNEYKFIATNNLYQNLNSSSNEASQYQSFENAITVLKNKNDALPIKKT